MRILAGLICLFIFTACSDVNEIETRQSLKPHVMTVNYPLYYFCSRIGGDKFDLDFPEIEGDPAFWQPGPEDITPFQEADLIILNGATYSKWLAYVSLREKRFVNTSLGFQEDLIPIEGAAIHQHGPSGEHSHGELAFTTWLDPRLAIAQAESIKEAFSKLQPTHAASFEINFQQLKRDLENLDAELSEVFASLSNQVLIFSHPVYQYLERRYKLKARSLHWEPDEMPSDGEWRNLGQLLELQAARVLIWEAEPRPDLEKRLRSMGIQSVVFNPSGNRPPQNDYLGEMQENIKRLRKL